MPLQCLTHLIYNYKLVCVGSFFTSFTTDGVEPVQIGGQEVKRRKRGGAGERGKEGEGERQELEQQNNIVNSGTTSEDIRY